MPLQNQTESLTKPAPKIAAGRYENERTALEKPAANPRQRGMQTWRCNHVFIEVGVGQLGNLDKHSELVTK